MANHLARCDSLFVIAGLKSFLPQLRLARLLVKKSPLPPEERLRLFLEKEDNPILFALADEIAARGDLVGTTLWERSPVRPRRLEGEELFQTSAPAADKKFYLDLCAEIVANDYPQLKEQLQFFKRRLDIVLDQRFYASELETLNENAKGDCLFETDWFKTTRQELWLCFDEPCTYTAELSIPAQESLGRLVAFLLYEKDLFVSAYGGVGVNKAERVCFLDFDYLYPADSRLKDYAAAYFREQRRPSVLSEFKLARSLRLLEKYCKDIKVAHLFEPYWRHAVERPPLSAPVAAPEEMLRRLSASGMVFRSPEVDSPKNPRDLAYLLDSTRHKRDPRFLKSSVCYLGPLFVVIYLLFKYV